MDNPIEALKFKFNLKKTGKIIVKSSPTYELTLNNINSLNKLMGTLPHVDKNKIPEFLKYIEEIDQDSKYLTIGDIKYVNIYNSTFKKNHPHKYTVDNEEYFSSDEWDMINFKDRHIIDIGGNNGDTSLYFAKKGAAEVIGFEPVPHLYELAIENIDLNKDLKNKISYVNKAVGGKRGKLKITSNSVKDYIDTDKSDMEIITVNDILNNYNFTLDILKMDCEGCEFEIIENENLTMFNDIIFEHHSKIVKKDYNILINKLKKEGFEIDLIKHSLFDYEDIGIIHAHNTNICK